MLRRRFRGGPRLAGWLGVSGKDGRRVEVTTRYGSRFELDPFEYIDSRVVREGFYESEVFDAALAAMPSNGVFWDVGANIGLHALTMASRLPEATVVAFEPSPREFTRLVRCAALNSGAAIVLPIGLSNRDEVVQFHVCETNSGRNGMSAWGDPAMYSRTIASVAKGDTLVARGLLAAPNVIKIDVEGSEFEVLSGMETILSRRECKAVIFESGPDAVLPQAPIRALFDAAGFTLSRLDRNESTAHDLDNYVARRTHD